MMKKRTKKIKIVRGEKIIYLMIAFLIISIPIINVFSKALLSESSIELEKLKKTIADQQNINESLNMQINELASLDKIQEVANAYGLSYNNDNIKVITE